MGEKGNNMAEYRVPENQKANVRTNEQSEKVTATIVRTFTEAEVLALLQKAKEVNVSNGRE